MLIYLQVEYEDRQLAKQAGARWDPLKRKWYIDESDVKRYVHAFRIRKERTKKTPPKWVQLRLPTV